MLLLLLIFAANELDWWLSPIGPSRPWFRRQIIEKGLPDIARDVADISQRDMLDDLDLDLFTDPRIRRKLHGLEDRFISQLSDSLDQTVRNWQRVWQEKRFVRKPNEEMPELYPSWKAKRDAVTKTTEVISDSVNRTRSGLQEFYGINLIAEWKLDPFSNWCEQCLALANKYEFEWMRIWPGYPPRHPFCRCGVVYHHELGTDGGGGDAAPFRRRGIITPDRILTSL